MDADTAQAMAHLTTGIYVLTVGENGRYHGMSSSWVTQVSGEPPLLMAAVDRRHFSHAVIERTGVFALNVLGRRGRELEDYFYSGAARHADNLAAIAYDPSPRLGLPWLRLAMVSIEARTLNSIEAGDHTLFIAEPLGVRLARSEKPLCSLDLDYVYVGGAAPIARDRCGWGR